jgi:hypothetical protein
LLSSTLIASAAPAASAKPNFLMIRSEGHDPSAPTGSWRLFLCIGPGWASASNTPFRWHKIWTHKSGISTPLIVHWPNGIKARGEFGHDQGHAIDSDAAAGAARRMEARWTELEATFRRQSSPDAVVPGR